MKPPPDSGALTVGRYAQLHLPFNTPPPTLRAFFFLWHGPLRYIHVFTQNQYFIQNLQLPMKQQNTFSRSRFTSSIYDTNK